MSERCEFNGLDADLSTGSGSDIEDTRGFTEEECEALRREGFLMETNWAQGDGAEDHSVTGPLATRSLNGGKMEIWATNDGVAAGEVLDKDPSGQPRIWESFGGSLYGTDSKGRVHKIRDKWG